MPFKNRHHCFSTGNELSTKGTSAQANHVADISNPEPPKRYLKRLSEDNDILLVKPKQPKYQTVTILRPAANPNKASTSTRTSITSNSSSSSSSSSSSTDWCSGNRIINLDCLSQLLNKVFQDHMICSSSCINPNFQFPKEKEKLQGLGSSLCVTCTNCSYLSKCTPLYKHVKIEGGRTSGAAEPNVGLAAWHLATSSSFNDTRLLSAYLDCPSISENGLMSLVGKVQNKMADLGIETMEKNCELIKNVLDVMGKDKVVVATDTLYNNPSKGQFFQQNGTQSSSPMCEMITERNLTLSMNSLSQICTCVKRHSSDPCKAGCGCNLDAGLNVGSQEGAAARDNILQIEKSGLKVGKIVCDGTHQIMASLQDKDIKKQECTVHRSRGTRRKVYNVSLQLSKECHNQSPHHKRLLADDIAHRCQAELTSAKNKFEENEEKIIQYLEKRRQVVLECMSSNHIGCHRDS